MKKLVLIIMGVTLFLSVNSDVQRKQIRSGDYDIVCYVALKEIKHFIEGREYFWFKTGEIHNSISQSGGLVLHNEYEKFYRSRQLAEKGNFDYGLKDGEWRTWHENGNIQSISTWKNGQKNGLFLSYDEDGTKIQSGTYNNNEKTKLWINHKLKDTVYYKGDSAFSAKPKSKLKGFFNRIFKKRDSTERAQRKLELQLKRRTDSIERIQRKQERQIKKEKGKKTE
ncbi:toxin-antitoxin system YwqK family antitoxin [Psychroserpens algicola]|uniref:MORN repeat variant n=1 Tax=Psychroserpens algicola TaxID=1719034 RepID=A0ABT0H988_9FLAO|nr:hypothetical protein [Psychroserpens algicola]MCK8480935.1 hypothetical protein [Psychroserpens algicola]